MTTDARSALLAFLQSEAPRAHSADDLAALLGLDRAVVDATLAELRGSGEVTQEQVTGYGGSQTVWTVQKG